ncbi:MAG: RNA-binding S4 domain-containing protein [Candidatus Omnitrophica bacterium]|nr:RNA-binding S4 domain-containing protein [Candidatus Omnitrophota bacterium]
MEEYKTIKLAHQPCELCKILKLHDLVQSGGHAKLEISQGHVKVNNQIETRKAKKIVTGDIIEFENKKFKVII